MSEYIFGYIRVSSKNQNLDRQRERLLPLITSEACLYEDKQSGKDFNREQYQELKRSLRSGDTLIVTSLDRLGRDYSAIKDEWKWLWEQGIILKVLDTPLLDTSKYDRKDINVQLMFNLTLEILSFVAETERKNIRQRQAEGIAIAKAKGIHLGRPKTALPDNWDRTIDRWEHGEIQAVEAQRILGMKPSTFYKKYKDWKEDN